MPRWVMRAAAVEHRGGIVLGQTQAPEKSNETSAVRNLSRQLDLSGRTVTLDAMHKQQETARILRNECAADYVMTAVKDNRPTTGSIVILPPRADLCFEYFSNLTTIF